MITSMVALATRKCTSARLTPLHCSAQQACHNCNIKLKFIFHVGIIKRIIVPIKEEDVIKIDTSNFHHTTQVPRKMMMTRLMSLRVALSLSPTVIKTSRSVSYRKAMQWSQTSHKTRITRQIYLASST